MSIEKETVVDRVEVLSNGCVQVRTRTNFVENGETISFSFHRHVIEPGQFFGDENQKVKDICAAVHTPEAIAAYQALLIAQPE